VAIARWHGGKIALLWVGTLGLFLAARSEDLQLDSGYWILAAVVSGVITWRWFSFRERTRPRPVVAGPTLVPTAAIGQAIADRVWAKSGKPPRTFSRVLRGIKPPDGTVLFQEVLALRTRAAHVAVAQAVGTDGVHATDILDAFYSALAQHEASGLTGKELVQFLTGRGQDYAAALTITTDNESFLRLMGETSEMTWSGNPAQDVGKLFTHHVGCPRDLHVMLAGTGMFLETLQETRAIFGK